MTQAELDELTANADILGTADENAGESKADSASKTASDSASDTLKSENADSQADKVANANTASTNQTAFLDENADTKSEQTPIDTASEWGGLPPPSTEHKVVHQLDEVTRDSEVKAIEMMERLETIEGFFSKSEGVMREIKGVLAKNAQIFGTLCEKFSQVQTFADALKSNENAISQTKEIFDFLQQGQDEIFVAIGAMQYQDIHRQKIERAINVMRALSRYMNTLFEGTIDDSKRVSSAVHIAGDSTKDVMNDGDIEDLIASLRGK